MEGLINEGDTMELYDDFSEVCHDGLRRIIENDPAFYVMHIGGHTFAWDGFSRIEYMREGFGEPDAQIIRPKSEAFQERWVVGVMFQFERIVREFAHLNGIDGNLSAPHMACIVDEGSFVWDGMGDIRLRNEYFSYDQPGADNSRSVKPEHFWIDHYSRHDQSPREHLHAFEDFCKARAYNLSL